MHWHGGRSWVESAGSLRAALLPPLAPAIEHPNCADHGSSHYRHGPECMRDAAVVLQLLHLSCESPSDVQIGRFGGEQPGQRSISRFAVESGSTKTGAGKE